MPPPVGEASLLLRGVKVAHLLALAHPDAVLLPAGDAESPGEREEEGVAESWAVTAGDTEAIIEIEGGAEGGVEGEDVPLPPPVETLAAPDGAPPPLALPVWVAAASLVATPLPLAVAAPLKVGGAEGGAIVDAVAKELDEAESEARPLDEAAALDVAGAPLPLAGADASMLRVLVLERAPVPLPIPLARPVSLPLGVATTESAPEAVAEGMLGAGLKLPPPEDALARALVVPRSSALGAALDEAVGAGAEGEPPPVAEMGAEAGGEKVEPPEAEPAPPAVPVASATVAVGAPVERALTEALAEACALREAAAELEGERDEEGEAIEEEEGGGEREAGGVGSGVGEAPAVAVLPAVGDAPAVPLGLAPELKVKVAPRVPPAVEDALRLSGADAGGEVVGAPEEDGAPLRELDGEGETLREGGAVALSAGERDAERDTRGDGVGGGEGAEEGERPAVAVCGAERDETGVADVAAEGVAVGSASAVAVAEDPVEKVPAPGERLGEPEADSEAVPLCEVLPQGLAPVVSVAPLCVPLEEGEAPPAPEGVCAGAERLPGADCEAAREALSRALSLGAVADGSGVTDAAALPHADTLPP